MNKIYVFCILLALAIVPVKSREPIGKKLCLNVESNGSVGKYGNFTFSGRISGHESVPHYGYWVAGFDRTGAYWAESDGVVVAWRRSDGDKLWTNEQLKHRTLSSPLLVGRALVVGDAGGYVHFLFYNSGKRNWLCKNKCPDQLNREYLY